jgi:arylformamidase
LDYSKWIEEIDIFFKKVKVVDLSPLLENDMPRFPTHPPIVIYPTITHSHDGYYCQTLFMPEHIGSHVDAPFHIHPNIPNLTVETISIKSLIGPAKILDLSNFNLAPGEFANVEHIKLLEKSKGFQIEKNDIVLVNFGWMKKTWTNGLDWKTYAGNSPGLDKSVAEYFIERKIKAIGSDTIACGTAIKDCESNFCWIHNLLLPQQIYLMECLANLEALPINVFFIALPLKISKGSGSPIRPIALIYE